MDAMKEIIDKIKEECGGVILVACDTTPPNESDGGSSSQFGIAYIWAPSRLLVFTDKLWENVKFIDKKTIYDPDNSLSLDSLDMKNVAILDSECVNPDPGKVQLIIGLAWKETKLMEITLDQLYVLDELNCWSEDRALSATCELLFRIEKDADNWWKKRREAAMAIGDQKDAGPLSIARPAIVNHMIYTNIIIHSIRHNCYSLTERLFNVGFKHPSIIENIDQIISHTLTYCPEYVFQGELKTKFLETLALLSDEEECRATYGANSTQALGLTMRFIPLPSLAAFASILGMKDRIDLSARDKLNEKMEEILHQLPPYTFVMGPAVLSSIMNTEDSNELCLYVESADQLENIRELYPHIKNIEEKNWNSIISYSPKIMRVAYSRGEFNISYAAACEILATHAHI